MSSDIHKEKLLIGYVASIDYLTIPVSVLIVALYMLTPQSEQYPDIFVGYENNINVSSRLYLFTSAPLQLTAVGILYQHKR